MAKNIEFARAAGVRFNIFHDIPLSQTRNAHSITERIFELAGALNVSFNCRQIFAYATS
jgi:hypothetical protein